MNVDKGGSEPCRRPPPQWIGLAWRSRWPDGSVAANAPAAVRVRFANDGCPRVTSSFPANLPGRAVSANDMGRQASSKQIHH
jgi:hypothetical protein